MFLSFCAGVPTSVQSQNLENSSKNAESKNSSTPEPSSNIQSDSNIDDPEPQRSPNLPQVPATTQLEEEDRERKEVQSNPRGKNIENSDSEMVDREMHLDSDESVNVDDSHENGPISPKSEDHINGFTRMLSKEDLPGVEVLSRIFPNERTGVLKLVLEGCGGDLLRAVEHLLSVNESLRKETTAVQASTTISIPVHRDICNSYSPRPSLGGTKSAFAPLPLPGIPPPMPPSVTTTQHQPLFPTRSSLLPDHLIHRNFPSTPTLLPFSSHYPSVIPPLFMPPLGLSNRPYLEGTVDPHSEYPTTRFDFLARTDIPRIRGLDIRHDIRLRSPSTDDSA